MRVPADLFICFSRPRAGGAEEGTAAWRKQSAEERDEGWGGWGGGVSFVSIKFVAK